MNGRVSSTLLGLVLAVLLVFCGCERKPADWHRIALQAEAQARQAFVQHEADVADHAAERAEKAARQLQRQVGAAKTPTPDLQKLLQEASAAAVSARNFAQLACEERECRQRLASLKLKAYRGVRGTVCTYGLAGLAPVAEEAARAGTNSLPRVQQPLALLAWNTVHWAGERAPLTNGAPDWPGAAADLRAWATNPPPRLGLFLAGAFALSGLGDFALSEIESVNPTALTLTNARSCYHLERAALYAYNGWDRTAARELEQAMQLSPGGWSGLGTTQALAVFHFWLADHALERKHFAQAELEVAAAAKAWPDNPLGPFLKGEQLALHGEWGQAADALQAEAAASKDEWLAQRLTERAQHIRETQGQVAPLFSDPVLVLDVVVHTLRSSAADSAALKQLDQFLNDARAFGKRLTEKLPGQ